MSHVANEEYDWYDSPKEKTLDLTAKIIGYTGIGVSIVLIITMVILLVVAILASGPVGLLIVLIGAALFGAFVWSLIRISSRGLL